MLPVESRRCLVVSLVPADVWFDNNIRQKVQKVSGGPCRFCQVVVSESESFRGSSVNFMLVSALKVGGRLQWWLLFWIRPWRSWTYWGPSPGLATSSSLSEESWLCQSFIWPSDLHLSELCRQLLVEERLNQRKGSGYFLNALWQQLSRAGDVLVLLVVCSSWWLNHQSHIQTWTHLKSDYLFPFPNKVRSCSFSGDQPSYLRSTQRFDSGFLLAFILVEDHLRFKHVSHHSCLWNNKLDIFRLTWVKCRKLLQKIQSSKKPSLPLNVTRISQEHHMTTLMVIRNYGTFVDVLVF